MTSHLNNTPYVDLIKQAKKKKPNHYILEKLEQRAVIQWLESNKILFFVVANGRKANVVERMELKRLGVRAGIPDIVIPIPCGEYHGFFAELKSRSGGKVSDAQKFWLAALTKLGYYACVPHGADQFIQMATDYLKLGKSNGQQ